MDGPVISFDVSKGESHMRAFESNGKPFGKVAVIRHDEEGFKKIRELHSTLRGRLGVEPAVVYESTGVYAMPLLGFFVSEGYSVYRISPLESAKMRKAEVRPTKSDSLDTGTIARVFYSREMSPYVRPEGVRDDFREMSRQYQYELSRSVVEMNRYRRCLDAVWPLFDEIIDYSSEMSLRIVERFGHPSNIRTAKGVLSVLRGLRPGKSGTREGIASKVIAYRDSHPSGVAHDSYMVRQTMEMAARVRESLGRRERLLNEMAEVARAFPEFEALKTLPAVSDLSAVRLLSEIGDIGRYPSSKAFIAYIGLDPMVMQSGKQSGEHMHITKKGNAWLRTTLYLIVGNICRCCPESRIAKFVSKKKNDGLCYKAAKIAGSAKLARIVYSMLSNGTCYSEE